MQRGDEQARAAQWLFASAFQGVLSTHSLEHSGYPFGSVVPFALDHGGAPVMLLSHLAQHTRNIDANPCCGLTLLEPGTGDVQQRGRLSAPGDVQQVETTPQIARYFDYFPHSRAYYDQLGFRFYRFQPVRLHWNGGFATARWFAASRILRANPFDRDTEQRLLAHLNAGHADAMRHYLPATGASDAHGAAVMVGIDGTGVDLRQGDRLHRVALPRAIATPDEARAVLIEMAGSAG
jgi:hypothetical protein